MITAEWVSAIAAVISIFISIWAAFTARNAERKVGGILMSGNKVIGSGTMVHIGDKRN